MGRCRNLVTLGWMKLSELIPSIRIWILWLWINLVNLIVSLTVILLMALYDKWGVWSNSSDWFWTIC